MKYSGDTAVVSSLSDSDNPELNQPGVNKMGEWIKLFLHNGTRSELEKCLLIFTSLLCCIRAVVLMTSATVLFMQE